jgi:hypothetical protein
MLHRVALVRSDVSEELSDSIIRMTRIGEHIPLLLAQPPARTVRKNHSSVVIHWPLLSNGRLLWLHSFCSDWCYNIWNLSFNFRFGANFVKCQRARNETCIHPSHHKINGPSKRSLNVVVVHIIERLYTFWVGVQWNDYKRAGSLQNAVAVSTFCVA